MRIVFFGATNYSYHLLNSLVKNKYDVVSVFTLPRAINISYSRDPVKLSNFADLTELGKKLGIPVTEVNKPMLNYVEQVKKCAPDLILVLGWYYTIPDKILDIPPKGCVAIHASLLPKYAGGAPLVWAMINGEKKVGATLFYLDKGVDTGDIIAQKEIFVEDADNIGTIYKKVTSLSEDMLLDNLPLICSGKAPRIKQDISQRTIYPQRGPEDGKIDWNRPAKDILNFIRAQTRPYPGAYAHFNNMKIIFWNARITESDNKRRLLPGQITGVIKGGFTIATGEGEIMVDDYEPKDIMKKLCGQDLSLAAHHLK